MVQRRTGLPTIRDVAFALCQYVNTYSAIITKIYPANTALQAALVAAQAACHVLVEEADAQLPIGD